MDSTDSATRTYDVVVIGAGPVGENVADRVVKAGMSAAIVEGELAGGECSYWACIPSKALLRPPAALAAARSVDGARGAVRDRVDTRAALSRRDSFVSDWRDDAQADWIRSSGIELLRGWGELIGEKLLRVSGEGAPETVAARTAVVLATGSSAVVPPVTGLDEVSPWTNREGTAAGSPPQRLAVIGGGPVGCELAAMWASLGSRVTMVVRGEALLTGWEPFVGADVAAGLQEAGVRVRTGVQASRASRGAHGGATLELDDGTTLECDEVLVATGRRPRTDRLGLGNVGLAAGEGLQVDDSCRVTAVDGGWLYATGDVNQRNLLTHMGKYQARACADAIVARAAGREVEPAPWSRWAATADHAAVPQVLFTIPQATSVGLTEATARERGFSVRAVEYAMGDVAGAALAEDGYTGHAKLVVDEDRSVVLGCTFTGPEVGELIHAATVAVVGEVPLDRLWHAVPAFPTTSEVWLRLLEEYGL
ncbi:dihydrolipoyl dehydrogenase family protein [Streptomyces sulphureus]|uniref:dihydrolipoyl dehydrogenase family protein n=1 Tax=Streptomyces sulphureus TaxID=47758 RepID=UPI00037F907A|nr:NAD(P)/FAD-dependent oxidoreductase [Streptomyces sulphureus]